MGEHSPYVGKGPEVDKAWHAISYDSKHLLPYYSASAFDAKIMQLETK